MRVGNSPLLLFALVFLALPCFNYARNEDKLASTIPEQVHIALTEYPDEMSIVWVTQSATKTSTVKYSTFADNLNLTTTGTSYRYLLSPYIHAARVVSLAKATKYYYQVGDDVGGWSQVFSFATERNSESTVFVVIGDHGTGANSQMVFDTMVEFDKKQPFDFIVHAGDLSYADGVASRWDTWGRMIEPISSHVPWMVAAGNHEIFDLFVTFQNRFRMPENGDKGNLFYSFNYGLVHHITLDSETPTYSHLLTQYQWLKRDLESVNRTRTPWVFAIWHSPWYCSNKVHPGSGNAMRESFEALFLQHQVDLVFTGHVHAYERTHGVYDNERQSNATIYTVVGTGGNHEGLYNSWVEPTPEWSATRFAEYGFGRVTINNATNLLWEFIHAGNRTVIDSFSLSKPSSSSELLL